MDPRLVVLAGGASSRMKRTAPEVSDPALAAEALATAKCMIRAGRDGRPFLDFLLRNAEEAGYRTIVIVVAENDESITDYYQSQSVASEFRNMSFTFVPQKVPAGRLKPLGTADALLQALTVIPGWSGGKFTVCNSDNLYSSHALRLLLEDRHENAMIDYDRSALRYSQERVMQFAVVSRNPDGYLADILEKPSAEEARRAMDAQGRIGVSMNIWRFSCDCILPVLKTAPLHPARQEQELPLAVRELIRQKPRSVYAIPVSEHVPDLTSQADIPIVREYLKNR